MPTPRLQFEAIGTTWDITVQDDLPAAAWQSTVENIRLRIDEFDKTYSRFRPDSLVSKIAKARKPTSYTLPTDGYRLLAFYERLYLATKGRVTPLIGQAVADAGYDAHYSFKPKPLQRPLAWDAALSYTHKTLTMHQPVLLDFGAAGKGYLVDIVSKLLEAAGALNYYINAGGDIVQRTSQSAELQVGLENPQDTSEVIGIATISNKSLCASSGSKRKWDTYTHIINPVTLTSPTDILASWVIAGDTMTADGLATALFFEQPQNLISQFSFSYAILHSDNRLEYNKDFPLQTFSSEPA